jgi:thymidylate kinase
MSESGREAVLADPRSRDADATATPAHPVLRRLFTVLEQRGLRWILLRVPSNLAAPTGDVDLLVAPTDCDAVHEVAVGLGFVALPGWSSPPDLILVRYDRPSDRWLVLEIATTVSFRAPRFWELPDVAAQVLWRRRLSDGIAVPADEDAFWLLLLHCLLDKRGVAPHHRARLQRLVATGSRSAIGGTVCRAAAGGLTPGIFMGAVRSGQWDRLEELGQRLVAELKRRRPVGERLWALARQVVATARKPFLLPRRRGVNLALLGPNGVGKSTAAAGLQRTFPFESRVVYMGVWKAAGGSRVRAVMEVLARPARIWLHYLLAQYHQLRGRLVIFDRYVYEARLPARPPLLAAKRPYFWLLAHILPPARSIVVLDVPGDVAYGRKQENPPDELESERRIYAQLADRVASLELIDAVQDAETVRADITAIVWRDLVNRWQGTRSGS